MGSHRFAVGDRVRFVRDVFVSPYMALARVGDTGTVRELVTGHPRFGYWVEVGEGFGMRVEEREIERIEDEGAGNGP